VFIVERAGEWVFGAAFAQDIILFEVSFFRHSSSLIDTAKAPLARVGDVRMERPPAMASTPTPPSKSVLLSIIIVLRGKFQLGA
jgi:hypothetical protein